ncbi:L,D-transpeptidase family protein [Microbulbifer sp. OS29]|uniref:L,D-transpeptidase family protein n=1 Tax=Microbulbifer okhotskensis TaxID=2926617 RepID=A0A9X2J5B0_9GAMM|nr:L,D-transpeptidase family protein [Microbulbifer okhotskensis]MCO1333390.1 L,D-transpeptidase family protein [Microbulbifer okhotskensis]
MAYGPLQLSFAALLSFAVASATPLNEPFTAKHTVAIEPEDVSQKLRNTAQHYRKLARNWRPIAQGKTLQPGDRNERVLQMRNLLALYQDYRGQPGPLSAPQKDPRRFDSALQIALERFQQRHGLRATGIADEETLTALAVSPIERAQQMKLNAARWEKLNLPQKGRYVIVNIPDYRLQLVEDGLVRLNMKTVVGKSSTRTPNMHSRITNIVFNPTWTVPRSILVTELLPKARHNPTAMHKRGYRVVQYRSGKSSPITEESIARAAGGHATLRQMSGPENTLGKVKFVIPNKQAIFLHDTQAQSLFRLQHRALSHGCVRLQAPEELAYFLLNTQGWDRTRIAQAANGHDALNVRVNSAPRLFLIYITAWIDRYGQPQFREDIYLLDNENNP